MEEQKQQEEEGVQVFVRIEDPQHTRAIEIDRPINIDEAYKWLTVIINGENYVIPVYKRPTPN